MKTIMKTNLKFLAIVAFLGLFTQSCSDNDDPSFAAPVISNFEYGEGDDHSTEAYAYKGGDIHLEADIHAEGTVESITLIIHAHDLTPGDGEVEWDLEQSYSDSKYQVINPTFHEHVEVPSNIPAGEYHIELIVTDKLGNSTEVDGHIDIMDPITIDEFSIDESVVRGSDVHIEFMIAAINGIHNISVDIHGHDLPLEPGEVEWDFEKTYEEGYHEETEVEFHEHIDVPATAPAGEYHVSFTIEDEDGNTFEYETHFDVTAS